VAKDTGLWTGIPVGFLLPQAALKAALGEASLGREFKSHRLHYFLGLLNSSK